MDVHGASEARQAEGSIRVWSTCEPEGLSTPLWCGQAGVVHHGESSPAYAHRAGRGPGITKTTLVFTPYDLTARDVVLGLNIETISI